MQSSDGNKTYCPTGPTTDTNYCVKPSNGGVFTYSQLSAGQDFNLIATNGSISYTTTKDSSPSVSAAAASFARTWGGSGSDVPQMVVRTSDGGYVVVGGTSTHGAGGDDSFLLKYDASGNLIWDKTWGGTSSDVAKAVIQTSDGGYAITGYTSSFGAGNIDAFLLKYDDSGNLSWNKTWGGSGGDYGYDLIKTNDGGYAVAGQTSSYGAGGDDSFLLKYDASGNLIWNKTWGGTSSDGSFSLIQASDGSYALAGSGQSYGAGGVDSFLLKYDASGNLIWNKTWGGTGSDSIQRLINTSDGGYALSGSTYSYTAGSSDALLLKYDASGNLSWNKTWGGLNAESFQGLAQVTDGGYVLSGYTGSYGVGGYDVLLARYDNAGNLSWSKTWGGANGDVAQSIAKTNDGNYIIGSYTASFGAGSNESALLKFKSDGSMNNCLSPMCQSPTATVTSPSATVTTPSATTSSPTATVTSPTATVTTPSSTVTTIVAP